MGFVFFFGSHECMECSSMWAYLTEINKIDNKKLIYIDAISDETQDFCDAYDIDELPCVLILGDNEDVEYKFENIGSLPEIMQIINK